MRFAVKRERGNVWSNNTRIHRSSSVLGWASRVLGAPLAVICEGKITGDAGMKKKSTGAHTHNGGWWGSIPYGALREYSYTIGRRKVPRVNLQCVDLAGMELLFAVCSRAGKCLDVWPTKQEKEKSHNFQFPKRLPELILLLLLLLLRIGAGPVQTKILKN
jgi:hypothetical protein